MKTLSILNKLITWSDKTINIIGKISIQLLIIYFISFAFWGCNKNSLKPRGAKKVVEGIVLEDCNGNVSKGKIILLQYLSSGCFGGGVISEKSTMTDDNGYFKFEYREAINDGSTTSFFHNLTIPNSSINILNPSGNLNLYPNDTLMNAIIHLKFKNTYTSNDTFYCQFKPSPRGFVEEAEQIQYIVGPFHDTTLTLKNLRIGNTNSVDNGKSHCGEFKWGIGKLRLSRYYTGQDGYFYFTHEPCAQNDSFDYYVDPIY